MGKMNGLFEHWFIRGTIGFILYLLGGWSKSLEIMMTFIIVDYISGYLKSIYKKEISSKKAFRGIIKKTSCILADLLLEVSAKCIFPSLRSFICCSFKLG